MDSVLQQRRKFVPGNGIPPEDVMARQRYYEAEGYPYEMGELFGDTDTPAVKVDNPCEGQEMSIIEQIRRTPLPMARKKHAHELSYVRLNSNDSNVAVKMKLKMRKYFTDFKRSSSRIMSIVFWLFGEQRIHIVTTSLGATAASYFKFLRFLWFLNFILFLMTFCFICIPQLAHGSEHSDIPSDGNSSFTLLIDGQGLDLEHSILFIGYYSNTSAPFLGQVYQLPVVYLVVTFWGLLVCLVWLIFKSEMCFLADKMQLQDSTPFSWRTLTTWDFNLTSKISALEARSNLSKELKVLVSKTGAAQSTKCKCVGVYVARILITILMAMLIIGGGVAVYFIVQTLKSDTCATHFLHEELTNSEVLNFILLFRVAMVITALQIFLPFLNELVIKLECYTIHAKMVTTNIRYFFMYLVNTSVLLYSLLALSAECECQDTGYCCWETRVGQEFYRLFWFDLIVQVLGILVFDVFRGVLVRCRLLCRLSDMIGYRRFNISRMTLDLMYTQVIVWFGLFFCPLLPLLAALRMFAMFLFQSWISRLTNLPPSQLFLSRGNVAYYSTILLGILLSLMVPLGWTVTQLPPSKLCGPFSNQSHMIDAITITLNSWAASEGALRGLGLFVKGLQSSAVTLPFIFLISIVVIYYRAKNRKLQKQNKDYLIQLDAGQRVAYERLVTAVSLIPPYDPTYFEGEGMAYPEMDYVNPQAQITPQEFLAHNPLPVEGPPSGIVYYYDEQTRMPRKVHIDENNINIDEPIL